MRELLTREPRKRAVRGVKGSRTSEEVRYRRELFNIVGMIETAISGELLPAIKSRESEFKTDGELTDLTNILRNTRARFGDLESLGTMIANRHAMGVNVMQSKRFNNLISRGMGIDLPTTLTPKIATALESSVVKNVSLIKSIPEQHFSKIEQLIHENVTKGRTGGSLIADIKKLNGSTKKKAKLIARDQTAKLVSNLNKERQQQAGVVGYQWRNSQDGRVRGNPSGLYPKSKFDHWKREGQYFLWENTKNPPMDPNGKPFRQPPADGHAGDAILCRCTADPVI
jgi:SPP1 gp7 family putative phage head morphogenesis protein